MSSTSDRFHALHERGILLLPNAWDAGTAKLIESLGAPAIATTSAAVAWSHGYADGNELPVATLAATVVEISRAVKIPLSVDFEGGYSTDPKTVGENVAPVIEAGAVGINLEDANGSPDLLCAKIEAIKRTAARLGARLFVNARSDGYLGDPTPSAAKLAEIIRRGDRYRSAGADGFFAPGVVDSASIRDIAAGVKLPLNLLLRPALPPMEELAKLGVRRVSAGSGLAQLAFSHLANDAKEFLRTGRAPASALNYAQLNQLMKSR